MGKNFEEEGVKEAEDVAFWSNPFGRFEKYDEMYGEEPTSSCPVAHSDHNQSSTTKQRYLCG